MRTFLAITIAALIACSAACSSSISVSSSAGSGGHGTGAGGAGAMSTGGAPTSSVGSGGMTAGGGGHGTGGMGMGTGGMASVIGTTCTSQQICCQDWAAACTAQGGSWDYCNNVECSGTPQNGTSVCHPAPPARGPDEFSCAWLNCKVGEVCRYQLPLGDGCSGHSCKAPPPPCDTNPTCACLAPDGGPFLGFSCTEDAKGNATITGSDLPSW